MTFDEMLDENDLVLLEVPARDDGVVFAAGEIGYFEAWSVQDGLVRVWVDVDPESFDSSAEPSMTGPSVDAVIRLLDV